MKHSTLVRTVKLGISSLLLHKLRSLLTTLGVLFGTSSVIAMLAIGEGASEEAQEQIRQLGSRNVILRSIKPREDFATGGGQSVRVLSYGLTEEFREWILCFDAHPELLEDWVLMVPETAALEVLLRQASHPGSEHKRNHNNDDLLEI